MRPIRETISLEAARTLIGGAVRPIERTERVRIDHASGRVVARPVEAQADVPPFARAAMDGYAVRAADTFGASTHDPRVLTWVETVFTGQVPIGPSGRRSAPRSRPARRSQTAQSGRHGRGY